MVSEETPNPDGVGDQCLDHRAQGGVGTVQPGASGYPQGYSSYWGKSSVI